jgi:SAM-dependent methyltransferase
MSHLFNYIKKIRFIRAVYRQFHYWSPSVVISFERLLRSLFYNKNNSLLQDSSDPFRDIYNKNLWRSQESVSGGGSELAATETIRKMLPLLIDDLSIRSMLDVPCGDFNWMQEVIKKCESVDYIGGDIVVKMIEKNKTRYNSNHVQFIQVDITKDELPKVDLIFCKDCLQHLSFKKVIDAINNFKKSGSKYLLVTSYPWTWRNYDILDGDYCPLNLQKSPFCLPKPLQKIKENSTVGGVERDKTMYLYELSSITLLPFQSK